MLTTRHVMLTAFESWVGILGIEIAGVAVGEAAALGAPLVDEQAASTIMAAAAKGNHNLRMASIFLGCPI